MTENSANGYVSYLKCNPCSATPKKITAVKWGGLCGHRLESESMPLTLKLIAALDYARKISGS